MDIVTTAHKPEIRVIVLAEDDKDDVFLFKRALANIENLDIKVATNGIEALTALHNLPEAEIIFLDVNMPIMNGLECLLEIKNTYKDVAVIILTTSSSENLISQAKTSGASGFICKPISLERFRAVMRDVLSIDWKKHYPLFYLSVD